MAEIRRPNIISPTVEGKIKEISTYLHLLVDDLNFLIRPSKAEKKETESGSSLAPEQIFESIKEMIFTSRELIGILTRDVKKAISGMYVEKESFSVHITEVDKKLAELQDMIEKIEVSTVVVDSELSETSENPVANKVITAGLMGKANVEHTHDVNDISIGAGGESPLQLAAVLQTFNESIEGLQNRTVTANEVSFNYQEQELNLETVEDALCYLLRQNQ